MFWLDGIEGILDRIVDDMRCRVIKVKGLFHAKRYKKKDAMSLF